jgi:hypothetical protein
MTTQTPFVFDASQFVYINDPGLPKLAEKRSTARVHFFSSLGMNEQQLASLPSLESFSPIESRDLSQGGMSFYCDAAPEDRWLIIRIAEDDGTNRLLTARIVRCEKDYDDESMRFIVGCEFTGRLEPVS